MTKRNVVGLAAVLALTTSMVFAQVPADGRKGRMGKGHMAGRMANHLGLTDTQKQQIKDIREQARTQAEPFTQQIQTARAEVEKLVKAGEAPEAVSRRAEELAAANANAVQKLAGIRAWTAAKMFSILTPEQREKAQAMRDSFGGRGFGPMGFEGRGGGKMRAPRGAGSGAGNL
ncbi:MAG TPA: Spy/CpxP family protein refolding chaperone [Bryobacteraceae bacterium]|nr:Spy/CpxP family protein refolding chaperone [Bryobacteraceae bacterium]